MRVLVCPDSFTGTLSAGQAAAAVAEGWRSYAPGDALDLLPLSDGGPGFVDVLHAALGGDLISVTVDGPLGSPTPAGVLVVDGTAYVESAQACGLHLVPGPDRDPGTAGTSGVGQLVAAAVAAGARRVVVGLGGSATNDAGAGLLAALGAAPGALLRGGGAGLGDVTGGIDITAARAAVAGVELVVASDVDSPLLGPHGASRMFGEQKGADADLVERLEASLAAFSAALGVEGQRAAAAPGAGAAGGLGFALLLLGARRVPGMQAVSDAVDLPARVRHADLVVTGEGSFDWQSLRGKVVAGVARTATAAGRPTVVLAGQVLVGRREMQTLGVESAYAVAETPAEVAASTARPAQALSALAARVARTWSPRRSG